MKTKPFLTENPRSRKPIPCFIRVCYNASEHVIRLKHGIATLPGSAFHADDPYSLRLSSSFVDTETDEKAEALVEAFTEDPDPARFIQEHHPGLAEVGRRLEAFVASVA